MLRTGHANNYTPPGFADEIDGDNVVESSWRKESMPAYFNLCLHRNLEATQKEQPKA